MANEYVISAANLTVIERNLSRISEGLSTINSNIEVVDSRVGTVNDNVKVVYNEVGALANEFREFVKHQQMVEEEQRSRSRIIELNQELEKKYGKFDKVREHATGILQADDLGIIRADTITTAAEELMLATPGYWLTPNLVALAAWINNEPKVAEKALREGIKRNDEKTSLFWALVCRRSGRKPASLKWTQRYLSNQDEKDLDSVTIIILDAFASGLLGSDSEGIISKQMATWLEKLAAEPGFVEKQTQQWSDAINLKKKPLRNDNYPYLRKFSHTWPALQEIMEGAELHANILNYFTAIFEQEASTDTLKEQLDTILNDLVSEYDTEELPIRKEKKYHQFVVDFHGDTARAQKHMKLEESAYETHKDFTQLLTDAAMKPESSHSSVSTQKFAIALSKQWITTAYNDVTAQNRAKIPYEIEINVDTFNGKTTDGYNEPELLSQFNTLIDSEKATALSQCTLSGFEKYCLFGGIGIGVLGIIMLFFGGFATFLGVLAIAAAIGLVIFHFSKKKKVNETRQNIENQFEEKRNSGTQIIRATLAEVVDFRAEFSAKDNESLQVLDFLEQISPEQYVRKLADSNRRIKVSN